MKIRLVTRVITFDPKNQRILLVVEKARWFSKDEVKEARVFPKRLQTTFWENLEKFLQGEDPFIGIN